MIKSFSFLTRKPGMTHDQFVRHWHDVHVPMSHEVPGLRGYIVSTLVDQQTRADVPGFEMAPFDGLAQTFRRAPRRVVTSGGVELTSFFVFSRLRVNGGHQYLCRDWRDTILSLALFGRGRFFRELAIKCRMAQVAPNSFKRRFAAQGIKLRLNSKPDYPCIPHSVCVEK